MAQVHAAAPDLDRPQEVREGGRGLPTSLVLGCLAALAVMASAQRLLIDVDLYWHIMAGDEVANGTAPDQVGLTWSFAPSTQEWVSTQWLSEVAFRLFHESWGWPGLVGFRVITTAIAIGVLAVTTLVSRPKLLAGFPFALGMAAVVSTAQERPQQFTFIGAAALGGVLFSVLAARKLPRWWVLLPLTALWANLHGGWILAPGVLLIIAVGSAADRGPRDKTAQRAGILALMAAFAGLVSPAGLENVLTVFRVSSAAELISEWRLTMPLQDVGLIATAMLALVAIGWTRTVVPRSEVLAVGALTIFSWVAIRYVTPALLIMAPLVAQRLMAAFPHVDRSPEPRWSVPAALAAAGIGLAAALAPLPGRDVLPSEEYPIGLATRIAELPPGQRVLNYYDVAGMVLYFGGPSTQVAIDGRTDRYGSDYIADYVDLLKAKGDWQLLLSELAPTSALLQEDTALVHILTTEEGWQEVGAESGYTLLLAPGAAK